jgi:monoamine oxidase
MQHVDIESKIQLNKEVIRIKYSDEPTEEIILTCSDGSTYIANNLIITVPLGVLKANYQDLFHPPLPDKKIKVIQNYAYGAIGKIFLEFDEPFWPLDDTFVSYSLLWRDEDIKEVKSTNKEWLLGVAIIHKVDAFPNLLEMFVVGEEVRSFETTSDEKLTQDIMWTFEKFLNKKLPKPSKMIRTKWLTNKNFLGTYSYIGMGLQKHLLGPKDLAEPLRKSNGKPFIHFAGEATDTEFPGYAHGAVNSGWRAADEIIKN